MINELRKILTDRITVKQEEKNLISFQVSSGTANRSAEAQKPDHLALQSCFCSAGEGEIPLNAGAGLYEIKCSLPTC